MGHLPVPWALAGKDGLLWAPSRAVSRTQNLAWFLSTKLPGNSKCRAFRVGCANQAGREDEAGRQGYPFSIKGFSHCPANASSYWTGSSVVNLPWSGPEGRQELLGSLFAQNLHAVTHPWWKRGSQTLPSSPLHSVHGQLEGNERQENCSH